MILERNAAAAGFLIGLGVIINTLVENPFLGAALFSFGLLTIIELGLPLYTGQIGFITKKKISDLVLIFLFNGIGILIAFLLKSFDFNFLDLIETKAILKFDKTFMQLFIDAFFCGTLIHFAVKCKKQLLTVMAIMIFILMGAEHCIADICYLVAVPSIINFLKFFTIVMGNSLGAILLEMMLKKEGN